ncbi:unnamed protein product [Lactuca virosa]|uniref:Uncharacterized protein n=1 Tax=Lactuca virosa TaxID=75947 RepID=A0AAU9MXJ1_9ASTR|nr:unnamed protein product [Lactuca virosa]
MVGKVAWLQGVQKNDKIVNDTDILALVVSLFLFFSTPRLLRPLSSTHSSDITSSCVFPPRHNSRRRLLLRRQLRRSATALRLHLNSSDFCSSTSDSNDFCRNGRKEGYN